MLFPFLILAEPKKVFERLATRSRWLAPLITCTVGFFIITWLAGCWTNIRDGLRLWSLLGPAIASMLIYLLMAAVLAFRPQGLFPVHGR